MAFAELTVEQLDEMIAERGAVANIGQITDTVKRHLERRVKRGELGKYRGFWNTRSSIYGIGPLKTIYALPEVADEQIAVRDFYANQRDA